MEYINKKDHQSVLDVLLENAGGISGLFEFLNANSLTDIDLPSGEYIAPEVINQPVVDFFYKEQLKKGFYTATADTDITPAYSIVINATNSNENVIASGIFVPGTGSQTLPLPDVVHIDSDESEVLLPAGVPMVCSAGSTLDTNAKVYIDAISTLTDTQKLAVDYFVRAWKAAGLWPKTYAFYPLVWANATANKWNLKNPLDTDAAFRLTFHGGITHGSTGIFGNAANGYVQTHFVPSTHGVLNNMGIGLCVKNNNNDSNKIDIGCSDGTNRTSINTRAGGSFSVFVNQTTAETTSNSDSTGYFSANRTGSSTTNRVKIGIGTFINAAGTQASSALPAFEIYISALNSSGTPTLYSNRVINCVTIHEGFNHLEALNAATILNTFMLMLNNGL